MTTRIDVHAHITPQNWEDMRSRYAGEWPRIAHDRPGCATLFRGDRPFRVVTDQLWDPARRIADMDAARVDRQLLSPPPDLFCYWADASGAAEFARMQNDHIADVVARHPARFYGAGTVPLQDPDLAVKELERVRGELQLHAIEIGTHVAGRPLADERLIPVFQAAERLDAPLFVHPCGPAIGMDRAPSPQYGTSIGYPLDTAVTIYGLVTTGAIERFPRLRICWAHAGGAFPFVLPRLEHAWTRIAAVKQAAPKPPSAYLENFYYDSITHSPAALRFLLDTLGAARVVMGTDYPFAMGVDDPVALLAGVPEAEQIMSTNAERFLGVKEAR
jgi:aminocarboxymuconate-semialdehyde decarboxylase